jgi:phosphoglycerate dehydrogenase-like enzyme
MIVHAYYHHPPAGPYLEQLRAQLDSDLRLTSGPESPAPPETTIMIAGRPTMEMLSACPALRSLIIPWAGLPSETRALLADFPGVSVHNLHHNAQPVAEMVLTLLLSAAKLVVPYDRLLRRNDWRPRYRPSQALLLSGKTALILGYGAIGRETAVRCKGLGMRVLAVRRSNGQSPDGPAAGEIHPVTALPELLPIANALLICLPHTPETDGLIDRQALSLLPKGSILVNVGRGPIVDETALYLALQNGHLHAAGLDVWYNYPADEASRSHTAPAGYPFGELDNVVMSPHRAGSTTESNVLRMTHLAALLNAATSGKPLPNRVDLSAGY